METEQKARIKQYARTLNSNVGSDSDAMLDFILDEVADRVKLYLNARKINPMLERIIARIVVGVYNKANAEHDNTGGADREIKSMSDNGQSVTFSENAKNYLDSADDDALFTGFTTILNRYREADCGNTGLIQN